MIPEAATKLPGTFLTGHFLPAVILLGVNLLIWTLSQSGPEALTGGGALFESLTVASVSIFFLIALLSAFGLRLCNVTLIKLYEGLWPYEDMFPFSLWKRKAVAEWKRKQKEIEEHRVREEVQEYYKLERELLESFPSSEDFIRPTRLGNIIAAFEDYPYRRYKIDAVLMWSRFLFVTPKEQQKLIAQAQSAFNFLVNLSFLFYLTAFSILILIINEWSLLILPIPPICALLGYGTYLWSMRKASWWGEEVKAVFDLYRLDVLKRMGVDLGMESFDAEREQNIWQEIQWGMMYKQLPRANVVKFRMTSNAEGESGTLAPGEML